MKIKILHFVQDGKCHKITILALYVAVNFLFPLNMLAQDNGQGLSDIQVVDQADPEMQKLKDEIRSYQAKLTDLDKQKADYENTIKVKRQQINNLSNQLDILGDNVSKLQLDIQSATLEIQKTDLEIANLGLEINHQQKMVDDQKVKMSDILRTVDAYDRKKSYLEVLVLKGDLGSFFKEANELQALEANLNNQLKVNQELKNQLEEKKQNLEGRRKQLDDLKNKLAENNERLAGEQVAKDQLLSATKGQEASFQKLLAQVKAEQGQINSDIQNLEVQARKKLAGGGLSTDSAFIWPTSSRKINAYFHDPDYPYRYIFEHPAIDVGGTPQGTPIRAARSGYVAKVKYDGTKGYAYILLVHSGGLSTVYGHISKPYIKEDDYVVQGEVIALSGGMPGSVGSGNLTTGPHLHFEVRLNGIPVDPLQYLP